MAAENDLKRFIDAQEKDYETALTEIKNRKKRSHWMWDIFPQIKGLGFSSTSIYYAINGKEEAVQFLTHPILGQRLINISHALLALKSNNANAIFGSPDDLKLQSCMTLFSILPYSDPVFELVLKKFFDGKKDSKTIELLK